MSKATNLLQILVVTSVIAASVATSAPIKETATFSGNDDLENIMDGRSQTAHSHDRKLFSELAHAKATSTLSQATYVYTLHLRLYKENAKPEMDVLLSYADMLNATANHSITEYAMKHEDLRYQIGLLKIARARTPGSVTLKEIAQLYVQIRQFYVEHSETLIANYTELAKTKTRIYQIKERMLPSKTVSQEEVNEARLSKEQTETEVAIATEQLEFAKKALAEAKADLDRVGR